MFKQPSAGSADIEPASDVTEVQRLRQIWLQVGGWVHGQGAISEDVPVTPAPLGVVSMHVQGANAWMFRLANTQHFQQGLDVSNASASNSSSEFIHHPCMGFHGTDKECPKFRKVWFFIWPVGVAFFFLKKKKTLDECGLCRVTTI